MKTIKMTKRRLWMTTERIALHDGKIRFDPHDENDQLIGQLKLTTQSLSWKGKYGREIKMTWHQFDELMKKQKK